MTDRDPYGRRRSPEENDYQSPGWEDEAPGGESYSYRPNRDPRRVPEDPIRRPAGSSDTFLPANDPYASSRYRPSDPSYGRGESGDQPTWPDRPYAPGAQRPTHDVGDPYGAPPRGRRQTDYDYDDYGPSEDLGVWEEEQRRGPRRPQRQHRPDDYEEGEYARRPGFTVPVGLTNAVSGQDARILLLIAGAFFSLLAMVAVVALRADSVGWFPLHINAAGETTRWGNEAALWRLPFTLGIMTVMNLIAGFVLGLRDRKLTWLMVVALPALHLLAWIALILIAW